MYIPFYSLPELTRKTHAKKTSFPQRTIAMEKSTRRTCEGIDMRKTLHRQLIQVERHNKGLQSFNPDHTCIQEKEWLFKPL
ncbi:hypothetical protein GCK32_019218 [Trichostrongylus colubriformis]|uniref:Uncharacterized protein n=1 Tax=Trichostrongylus colubriformis TaxID=6319 RepID=A0AAN8F0J1_TRICO